MIIFGINMCNCWYPAATMCEIAFFDDVSTVKNKTKIYIYVRNYFIYYYDIILFLYALSLNL